MTCTQTVSGGQGGQKSGQTVVFTTEMCGASLLGVRGCRRDLTGTHVQRCWRQHVLTDFDLFLGRFQGKGSVTHFLLQADGLDLPARMSKEEILIWERARVTFALARCRAGLPSHSHGNARGKRLQVVTCCCTRRCALLLTPWSLARPVWSFFFCHRHGTSARKRGSGCSDRRA